MIVFTTTAGLAALLSLCLRPPNKENKEGSVLDGQGSYRAQSSVASEGTNYD